MNRRDFLLASGTAGVASLAGCLSFFDEDEVIIHQLEAINYDSEQRTFDVTVEENGELFSDATTEITPITETETPSEVVDITLPEYPGDFSVTFGVNGTETWVESQRVLDSVGAERCVWITCEFDPLGNVEYIDEVGVHLRDFDCPDRFD